MIFQISPTDAIINANISYQIHLYITIKKLNELLI